MLLHVGFKPTTVGAIESHLAHRAVVDVFNFAVKSPDVIIVTEPVLEWITGQFLSQYYVARGKCKQELQSTSF